MRAVAWAMRRAGLRNVQELQIVFQSHEITLVMTQLLTIKNRISSVIIGGGGWGGGAPPSGITFGRVPPDNRNAEIDPGDNDPPPKMTQGVMTPPNPPSSPSTASSSGVARCWHSNAYFSLFFAIFFAIFLRPTEQICPDSAGPFHSFDPVGFAIFAIPQAEWLLAARSVKEECLSKVILFGERSLRRALSEYVEHFHAERNHQGRAMFCCSLGIRIFVARGSFNAARDWVGSCNIIIERRHK
jgi:hypothetical protein